MVSAVSPRLGSPKSGETADTTFLRLSDHGCLGTSHVACSVLLCSVMFCSVLSCSDSFCSVLLFCYVMFFRCVCCLLRALRVLRLCCVCCGVLRGVLRAALRCGVCASYARDARHFEPCFGL